MTDHDRLPPKISLDDLRRLVTRSWEKVDYAISQRRFKHALTHTATLQSWLKVLKRKVEAEQKKETQP